MGNGCECIGMSVLKKKYWEWILPILDYGQVEMRITRKAKKKIGVAKICKVRDISGLKREECGPSGTLSRDSSFIIHSKNSEKNNIHVNPPTNLSPSRPPSAKKYPGHDR